MKSNARTPAPQTAPPAASPTAQQAPAFDLKATMDKISKELAENLKAGIQRDDEEYQAVMSQLSAKDWTQAKAEKIVAELRASKANKTA